MRSQVSFVCIAAGLVAAGCGADLEQVGGKLMREGKSLARGRVVFTPIGGGPVASAEVQADGGFRLITNGINGAKANRYRVTIIDKLHDDTGQLTTTCVSPNEQVFEVVAGEANDFTIDVRANAGWRIHHEDERTRPAAAQ